MYLVFRVKQPEQTTNKYRRMAPVGVLEVAELKSSNREGGKQEMWPVFRWGGTCNMIRWLCEGKEGCNPHRSSLSPGTRSGGRNRREN